MLCLQPFHTHHFEDISVDLKFRESKAIYDIDFPLILILNDRSHKTFFNIWVTNNTATW